MLLISVAKVGGHLCDDIMTEGPRQSEEIAVMDVPCGELAATRITRRMVCSCWVRPS